jgi:dTDP-4-amino-4,6-dideoxygalactose transaminase
MMCNAEPVFVDVNKFGCIDPVKVEKAITTKTKAIVCVHLMGFPCDMNGLVKIARMYNIPLIEDCAQAHGASYEGFKVGSIGDVGCFSFYPTKNFTTGEGGMITTNDPKVYGKCKLYRNHGMTNLNTHSVIGYNYRMTEIEAAIGICQLEKIDDFNKKRRDNADYLYREINLVNAKKLNRMFKVEPLYDYQNTICKHISPAYFVYPIKTNDIEGLKEHLKMNCIEYRRRYIYPLYTQPIFKNKYRHMYLDEAEKFNNIFGLPIHPDLTKQNLEEIVEAIRTF